MRYTLIFAIIVLSGCSTITGPENKEPQKYYDHPKYLDDPIIYDDEDTTENYPNPFK